MGDECGMVDQPASIYVIEGCMEGIRRLGLLDCMEGIRNLGSLNLMESIEKCVGYRVLGCIIGVYPGGLIKFVADMCGNEEKSKLDMKNPNMGGVECMGSGVGCTCGGV